MDLAALDNAVVCDIAGDSGAFVDRPMDIKVFVDNIQIVLFTLEGTKNGGKVRRGGQNALDGQSDEGDEGVRSDRSADCFPTHLLSFLSK